MIVRGVMVVLRFVDEQICIDLDVFVVAVPLALPINVNILFIVAIEKRWKNRKQCYNEVSNNSGRVGKLK